MMRRAHYLTKNERSWRPRHFVFVGLEAVRRYQGPYRIEYLFEGGMLCYWQYRGGSSNPSPLYFSFHRPGEFWDWIESKMPTKSRFVVFLADFDRDLVLLQIQSAFVARGWEIEFFHVGGTARIFKIRREGGSIVFLSPQNYFPDLSLRALSPEAQVQVMKDAIVSWSGFIDEHDLGGWGWTVASQAFNAYRHRFMRHKIYIHANEEVEELERRAYRGGRCEVFQRGHHVGGPFFKLDTNSMYPFVMAKYQYPKCLLGYRHEPLIEHLAHYLSRNLVVARVLVDIKEPAFVVPRGKALVFTTGMAELYLTTEELKYALSRDWVCNVFEMSWYAPRPLFEAFVGSLYPAKVEADRRGDPYARSTIKSLLNFCYGKFGQKGTVDQVIGQCSPRKVSHERLYSPRQRKWYDLYCIGGKVIKRCREGSSYHAFPAIAAHVTANARMELWELLTRAGLQNVYYCDTDSLIVDQEGYDRLEPLIDPYKLGALKVEETSDEIWVWAKKEYQIGSTARRKGIKPSATQVAANTFRQEQKPTLRGCVGSGSLAAYQTKVIDKVLKRPSLS